MIPKPTIQITPINNNKVSIDNLVIEVTRRCNFYCDHCLRGEQEKLDIDYRYINSLLDQVDYINQITFTGGDPTLNLKAIAYTREKILEYGINLGSFYIATNGINNNNEDFIVELLRLYAICDDPENCEVAVSSDYFHDIYGTQDMALLEVLRFAHRRDENNGYADRVYINEGLYKENFGRGRELKKQLFILEDNYISDGEVYLNCEGNIIAGCDWSYESQRKKENIICRYNEDIIYNIKNKEFIWE